MNIFERERPSLQPCLQEPPSFEKLNPPSNEIIAPTLQHINTRVLVTKLRKEKKNSNLRLCDLTEEDWIRELDGSQQVWLMGAYTVSEKARVSAKKYRHEYIPALSDLDDEKDIVGSCFAIPEYAPDKGFVADKWEDWDDKILSVLHKFDKKVILDYVINNTALDNIETHLEDYIEAPKNKVERCKEPGVEFEFVRRPDGTVANIAHGSDPAISISWIDTANRNLGRQKVQEQIIAEVNEVAGHCDGLRCDMAKLAIPWVFGQKWGWLLPEADLKYLNDNPIWPQVIQSVRANKKDFHFYAEAYNLDHIAELARYGFDGVYDKEGLFKTMCVALQKHEGHTAVSIVEYMDGLKWRGLGAWPIVFSANHDEGNMVNFLDSGAAAGKVGAILAALVRNSVWLKNYGQKEGRGDRLHTQLCREVEKPADIDSMRLHDELQRIRSSALFQDRNNREDTYRVPLPLHEADGSNWDIVQHRIENADRGMLVCSNTASHRSSCHTILPEGCTDVEIYDLTSGKWIPYIRDHSRGYSDVPVILDDYHTQIIYYKKGSS